MDVLAGPLGISLGFQRVLMVLLATGLPVAIVLAWFHGEKGRQGFSSLELLLLGGLLAVGSFAAVWAGRVAMSPSSEPAIRRPPDSRPSLVALPWVNLSDLQEDAFFVDGVRDEILSRLARVKGLRVLSRTSAWAYRDTDKPLPAVANELGARYVLEGSLLRAGDEVQVAVTLIDGPADAQLWSESYREPLSVENLLDIQTDIAGRVADALSTTLSPADSSAITELRTSDLTALELYYAGRQRWRQRDEAGLTRAIELFRESIGRDSLFAGAWAGLADATAILNFHYGPSDEDVYPEAIRAARRATELDPRSAEAFASLAFALTYGEWAWQEAETVFLRAIALDPDYAVAHYWYCELLFIVGRVDEAVEECRRAANVDPRSATARNVLGHVLAGAGRIDEGIDQSTQAMELSPEWIAPHITLSFMYLMRDDPGNARAVAGPIDGLGEMVDLVTTPGADVPAGVRAVEARLGPDHFAATLAYAAAGLPDSALARLDLAIQARAAEVPISMRWPLEPLLGGDPRFAERFRALGVEDER